LFDFGCISKRSGWVLYARTAVTLMEPNWSWSSGFTDTTSPDSSFATSWGAKNFVRSVRTFSMSSMSKWSWCAWVMKTASAGSGSVIPQGSM
jgi:hypothetical protein